MSRNIIIRRACAYDAEAIYRIKRACFGATYLGWTIFRSEASLQYLRSLIVKSDQAFFVAERAGNLLGYANAVFSPGMASLSYVAVAGQAQSEGLGGQLLRETENEARARGQASLALDVFASNTAAMSWYLRAGYRGIHESVLQLVTLNGAPCARSLPLTWSTSEWQQAVAQEACDGFSKVQAKAGSGRITVGIIAGSVCKLLCYERVEKEEAVAAIAATPQLGCRELIVCGDRPLSGRWPIQRTETLVRMEKSL